MVAKSGQVTSKATGRLFENLDESLDGAAVTAQNQKILTIQEEAGIRTSNSQSGTRKTGSGVAKRPSSKPRAPESAPGVTINSSHHTLQSAQGP